MRVLILSLLIGLGCTFGLSQKNDFKLEIGEYVPDKYTKLKPGKPGRMIITHTSQFDPYFELVVDGVKYLIAYRNSTKRIVYISTKDETFETENGLKVGSEIEVAKEDFFWIWQLEIRAPATEDGWHPVVGYDIEGIERKPNFVERLSPGEKTKVRILGFIKDQYSQSNARRNPR
jgi:hypothetical protein